MRCSYLVFAVIMVSFLAGCGSRPVVSKKKEEPAAPAPAPAPVVSTPPAQPKAVVPERQPQPQPQPTAKQEPAAPATQAQAGTAKPAATTPEFADQMVGGRPISEYLLKLDSKNKDEVIEAINACAVARPKASIEKITALTKSSDKEIADEATQALRKIGAGR